ncbi:hypothetical protein E4U21_006674 [Claviceps maximensis]|nr:hypothetical protein E4U21_006674 [Claviceps maximensis]
MKLFTLLLTAVTVLADHESALWCNGGWEGNGGCEKMGTNTYCCSSMWTAQNFNTWRTVTVESMDKHRQSQCLDVGTIYCA